MRLFSRIAALAVLVVATACQDTGTATPPDPPIADDPESSGAPGPVQTGWILNRYGRPVEVTYEVQDGHAIWQGDIDLGAIEWISATAQEAAQRKNTGGARLGVAKDGTGYLWPGGVVPYVIPEGFPNASRLTDAIAHIEANTDGIEFVPRTTQSDYIEFLEHTTRCRSPIGRIGGVQYVQLASGCHKGKVIHELLHALGMYHEHARCDRDSYVTIQSDYIEAGKSGNFAKHCDFATDYHSYAEGSVMHYGPLTFSSDDIHPTIVSKRGLDSEMGQRTGMGSTDKATINTLYPAHDDDDDDNDDDDPTHDQGGGG